MSPKIKKLAIFTVVVLILFFGYKMFFVNDEIPSLSSESAVEGGGDVTILLNQLRSMRLDTNIFQDIGFLSLVDYGVTLDPQPVGRLNPFAPIGQGSAIEPVSPEEVSGDIDEDPEDVDEDIAE